MADQMEANWGATENRRAGKRRYHGDKLGGV